MFTDSTDKSLTRRGFIKKSLAVAATMGLAPWSTLLNRVRAASRRTMKTRKIPSSGEELPVVGVGTWQQFDVTQSPAYLNPLKKVLNNLFRLGGSFIDTSPMYGRAESVVGTLLESTNNHDEAFLATKVWTSGKQSGIDQMNRSMKKLNASTIDLIQVHNLVDWQVHMKTLKKWKAEDRIRYIGVTHYTRSAFDELETVMKNHNPDFVQLPYSLGFRDAEDRLLPLADDLGIAVIVNRPFQAGGLFRSVRGSSLPDWAKQDLGCKTWAQYFLKFLLGHPAVTCVIPGTSNPNHMLENARAGTGQLPNSSQRERMHSHWRSL